MPPRFDAPAGTRLFVGNLSWGTDNQSLGTAFSQFGEVVDAVVLRDRETDRSRGFGFVTFSTAEQANEAVARMDGQAIDGRNVRVNLANDRPQRSGF
ncbi:hypothetical protein HK105_206052 [Polyrhizophydium stewartii]|uniref:RRM domain-containing protein n=1 Tax=Polyrhizophydium stewartii TaxID=2732419 RepID=A0ABR4N4Q4_9FUNG|nr:Ribosome-interacting GTPase 2 [Polyrhizophydium stewartii]